MINLKDEKLIKKIGTTIKQIRNELGLTQEQVYGDTNIHIGRLESSSMNISVSTVSVLCKYFKIKLSDFFKRVEEQK
ncbi:helix-turn-helix domain-containing protein [Ferruginibacter sp. HRS2-29]|uniref:helix-turn-helix domain-containing protein n=1 Tax=Ferruginibacter sp. HRS2-29 TaxID=2487334 RepID=UPI0034E98265|nr:XRE family transcriptional regulator [Ferruginibacter sp. HRS2-29]